MSISNTFFISENYLKTKTVFNKNIDASDIVPNISAAQDMFIENILGKNFCDYLLNKYDNQSLSPDEISLVENIKPALAYRAAELTLPFVQWQIKNKGPQSMNGENTQSIDIQSFNYLRNEIRNRAEFYETKLIKFLNENKNKFAKYTNNNNYLIPPSDEKNAFDSGLATYDDECYFIKHKFLK